MPSGTTVFGTSLPDAVFLFVAFAVWVGILWMVVRLMLRDRERVRCPVHGRMARVTFVRAPDGSREDVIDCSLAPGGTRDCGKRCLHPVPV
jgi:hypothetical protein